MPYIAEYGRSLCNKLFHLLCCYDGIRVTSELSQNGRYRVKTMLIELIAEVNAWLACENSPMMLVLGLLFSLSCIFQICVEDDRSPCEVRIVQTQARLNIAFTVVVVIDKAVVYGLECLAVLEY